MRTLFHRAPFDERIDPPAQRRDMDVNPIIPPVNGGRIVTKRRALFRRKRRGKQLHILSFEDLLVVQDERLVELDQFFDANEVAFLAGQRRLLHLQRGSGAIDALDHGLLRGNGKFLVARFGNGNRVELHAHPVLQTLLRAVVLAVREAGQFDRAPHVARIARGSGQLIDRLVAPRDDRGGDQSHPAAHHVHGNHVQAFALVGRQLAKISAQQIGKRRRSIDAFIPAAKRLVGGSFDDRGPHDGNRQPGAVAHDHGFGERFGKRVGIGPAEAPRPARPRARQAIAQPAHAILADQIFQLGPRGLFAPAMFSERLPPKRRRNLRAFGARFGMRDHFLQGVPFVLGVEIRNAERRVIRLHFLDHPAVLRPHHVAGRKVHQRGVIGCAQKFDQVQDRRHIARQGFAKVRIEIRQAGTVDDEVQMCARVAPASPGQSPVPAGSRRPR